MIRNPERAARGGAVEGTTKTDTSHSVGNAIDVGLTSFDAGYDMYLGYAQDADLRRGYMSYGVGVGDKRGKGYL
jgi:hypothetical protein